MDLIATVVLLARPGYHEGSIAFAAMLARGGTLAFISYTVLVTAGILALGLLTYGLLPRVAAAVVIALDVLLVLAVANNLFWLLRGRGKRSGGRIDSRRVSQ